MKLLLILFLSCLNNWELSRAVTGVVLSESNQLLLLNQLYACTFAINVELGSFICKNEWITSQCGSNYEYYDDYYTDQNPINDAMMNLQYFFCNPNNVGLDDSNVAFPVSEFQPASYSSRFLSQRVCRNASIAACAPLPTTAATTIAPATTTGGSGHVANSQICSLLNSLKPYATPISGICNPGTQAMMLSNINGFGNNLVQIFSNAVATACVNNATGYADLTDFYMKAICSKAVCTITSC